MAQKKYASLNTLSTLVDNIKNLFATKSEMEEKSKVQMITVGETENLTEDISTLKIHKLTKEQYEEALANGSIDESALYLTPDDSNYTQVEIDEMLSGKADTTHTHSISDTTNLQSALDGKVPIARTINNKPLSADITLSASDIGASPSAHDHNDEYYTELEIDSKLANKSDITHTHDIADINELQSTLDVLDQNISAKSDTEHTHEMSDVTNLQTSLDEKVSTSRTINGKALSEDIILSATDIGADISGSANTALSESKTYTDNAVAQKSQVQIITWEADD